MLQIDPFHPVLHVQVFGFEQTPLTHDGEHIAARARSAVHEEN